MTDEEWSERIAVEKKARAESIALLCQALQKAGVPLLSLEIFDCGDSDCMVKASRLPSSASGALTATPRPCCLSIRSAGWPKP